jgi:hypothetical protein
VRGVSGRLESPTALQLRLFQTMGEIASEQNSTIILPIPLDLFRSFLESQNGSYGKGVKAAPRGGERGRAPLRGGRWRGHTRGVQREVSSEEVPTEMPDGEANR